MFKLAALKMLRVYQLFISPLKPRCCRYYPSCSQYAYWQFEKNNFFLAFFYTFFRIMRCNPLFSGGFNYPVISKKLNSKSCFKASFLAKIKLNFIYIPLKNSLNNDKFYLIKIIFKGQ